MSMAISGMGGSVQAMTGASMRMPPAQKMSNLFAQIDTSNAGSITKAQFSQAFKTMSPPAGAKAMGADAIFAKLDPNNTGSVSKQSFVDGMTQIMSQIRQQHHHANAAQTTSPTQTINASADALNQLSGTNINTIA